MRRLLPLLLLLLGGFVAYATGDRGPAPEAPEGMVLVPGGLYRAPIGGGEETQGESVTSFFMDEAPVTNAEFLRFVQTHPQWQRSRVAGLLADEGYLAHWPGDLDFGPDSLANHPVVNVSWFAARAYARAQGKRLLATSEWEWAAVSGMTLKNGRTDPEAKARLAGWLSAPARLAPVRSNPPDQLGAYDLHGLVWEWVLDIEQVLGSDDVRATGAADYEAFCGGSATDAIDPTDYAAFLRYSFRAGLDAAYTGSSLGFRLARDL